MKPIIRTRSLTPLAGLFIAATIGAPAIVLPRAVAPAQAGLLSGMSEQEEIKAGQQVAQQAQKEYGRALSPNDPMSRRVRAIGRRFANLSTRKNVPYSYTVLQNDKVLNAFAAPGGPIFVTTRLVKSTSNDAELAYVLGHETAHIDRKHIVNSVKKQQKAGLAVGILGAILGRGKNGNIIGAVSQGAFAVWASGYSRGHENESDTVGVRWMSQLGYDPRASLTMLNKLGEAGGSRGVLDKYLATHPAPAKRVTAVRAQIEKEKLLDVARRVGGPRLTSNFDTGAASGDERDYSNTAYPSNANNLPDYGDNGRDYDDGRDNGTTNTNVGDEVSFGAPLYVVQSGDDSVILAPVTGLARWANARISTQGALTTVQRGTYRFELRRNSTVAYRNGRNVTLAVAPRTFGGRLYAPLGDLVEGLGGRARFDEQLNGARVSFPNQDEVLIPLPR